MSAWTFTINARVEPSQVHVSVQGHHFDTGRAFEFDRIYCTMEAFKLDLPAIVDATKFPWKDE